MTDRPPSVGNEMSESDARSLLDHSFTGVLSMAAGSQGYGLPMSYQYDREENRIVVGFVNGPGSKKEAFVKAGAEVTMTVYNYEDVDVWESAVATGTLSPINGNAIPEEFVPVFFTRDPESADEKQWSDLDDWEREWYEIRVTDVSGRHSGRAPRRD
ncbi:FMN-binding domain protein [Halalkaliarchaeum desulfuricum]|uniref:FMN-binding domain protein n=1 Tax=Halalkaliarchaeum desulfuricum TaxID=2055893 RepID=A0A343TN43_9EURY|nr:pyridoxamine 5'-phosphate oxidase family protein [Halalkaliarchaeum desulfuricum]AUX10515.1 FMN-binding domain protein [Halalkaliarchaeum desulfuricum]